MQSLLSALIESGNVKNLQSMCPTDFKLYNLGNNDSMYNNIVEVHKKAAEDNIPLVPEFKQPVPWENTMGIPCTNIQYHGKMIELQKRGKQ